MAKVQKVLQEVFAWSVAAAMASTVMLVLILLAGCSAAPKAQESTLTDAERACFTGTMQAYQKVGRDEKVSVVCK